jgi:hypothetical protein
VKENVEEAIDRLEKRIKDIWFSTTYSQEQEEKDLKILLSDYKRVLKENEILKEEKEQAWEEWNNLEQGSYETELKLKEENRELKAEMKDGVIAIKLYALQTENEKLKKKIDLMENYMVENGWEICFDNIYAELNNCNGMERDWCRGDKLEKQDIHKYFSKKLLESEE